MSARRSRPPLAEDTTTERPLHQTAYAVTSLTSGRAITAAIKGAGYLHIPEGRDHTTPAETSTSKASIATKRTFMEYAGALHLALLSVHAHICGVAGRKVVEGIV